MLLNEITTSDEAKIKKINKALKETYGFTLVSEISTGKLNQLYTKIADDLYNLKLNQATAQDPAYMQKLLVMEGLKMIRDRKTQQLDEQAMLAGRGGRKLEMVVNKLADYVRKACDVGDSWETAIDDAMRAYELWPYRFDRDLVEHELRKLTVHDCTDALIYDGIEECGVMEGEECACDKCECDPCECDKLDEDLSFFVEPQGQGATVMNSKGEVHDYYDSAEEARKAAGELNDKYGSVEESAPPGMEDWIKARKPEFKKRYGDRWEEVLYATAWKRHNNESIEEDELEEANPDRYAERDWVRGIQRDQAKKSGDLDMELSLVGDEDDSGDDYFSYQAKKSKRNEMKEGYVKELRKLLEAEVEQAESLIAAKSFSQELQDMIEKLGRLVNEDLPAVADQMRDSHGADVATGFEDSVSGTLNGIMDNLRNSKQELDNSVSSIADGGMPAASNDMGDFSDEELGGEEDLGDLDLDADVDLELGDEELGDEFGGADELAGDEEEPLGRAKKESLRILKNKIVEAEAKLAKLKAKQ